MSYFERRLSLAMQLGDERLVSSAYSYIGNVWYLLGDYSKTLESYRMWLAQSEASGLLQNIAKAHGNIGLALFECGDVLTAMEHYNQQLDTASRIGDLQTMSLAYSNKGNALIAMGRYDEAMACYKRKLVMAEYMGEQPERCLALGNIGYIYMKQGNLPAAVQFLDLAIELGRKIGLIYYLCLSLRDRAEICLLTNRIDEARALNSEALDAALKARRMSTVYACELLQARIEAAASAEAGVGALTALLGKYQDPEDQARIYGELWRITRDEGHRSKAIALCRQSQSEALNTEIGELLRELENG